MIHTQDIIKALINGGLTYSPEPPQPYAMRPVSVEKVAEVISGLLCSDSEQLNEIPSKGKRLYYAKRADLHFHYAQLALAEKDTTKHHDEMIQVQHFRGLAEQMDFENAVTNE